MFIKDKYFSMNFIMKTFKIPTLLIIFFLFLFPNCRKNDEPVPYVYVNFYVNLSSPQFISLTSVGGWVYVTGGYKGIVIYRNSIDEFCAYDRACTYKPTTDCERIDVEDNGITAIDSCCGSRFLLMDGSVVNGPATVSLTRYKTYYNGTSVQVTN